MRPRLAVIFLLLVSLVFAREGVRYLRWNEIQPPIPEVGDSKQWDAWIRQRDFEIRSGIDRCRYRGFVGFRRASVGRARQLGPLAPYAGRARSAGPRFRIAAFR